MVWWGFNDPLTIFTSSIVAMLLTYKLTLTIVGPAHTNVTQIHITYRMFAILEKIDIFSCQQSRLFSILLSYLKYTKRHILYHINYT